VLCLAAPAASAHATLEVRQAVAGASYKAVMRIPHGCSGSATIGLRIRIPEGFVGVKPMLKPGWKIDTVKGPYDKPHTLFHAKLTEGVREIDWSGGRLPDDRYDEFIFIGTPAADLAAGETLYFPTVQQCETGVERWIEIPAEDKPAHDLKSPAPGLKILPARAN
jgi:uncharacterized protein YcnI